MAPDRGRPEMSGDSSRAALRRAYELGRARGALLFALPVLPLAIVAWLVVRDTTVVASAGSALFVSTTFFVWRGRDLARGVLPGALAGVLPFVAMVALQRSGAMGVNCMAYCVPTSAVSGMIAGLAIGGFAARARSPGRAWIAGGVTATLVGALACACMGIAGVLGLAAGLFVGSAPLAIRAHLRGA